MGIYVESGSNESISTTTGGSTVVGRTLAAQANQVSDLIEVGPDGKSYPVKISDYSAVSNKSDTVIAETSVINGRSFAYSRYAVLRDPLTGNFFYVAPDNAGSPAGNCMVYKVSPGGDILGSVTTPKTGLLYNPFIKQLSNGNIVIVWGPSETNELSFFIVDKDLNVVVGDTVVDVDPLYGFFGMDVLPGGGFAISYTKVGATQNLVIYDNDGGIVSASASIQSWGGTAAIVATNVKILSNGNICIVCTSPYSNTEGTYLAIFTPLGAEVVAMVSINVSGIASVNPEIASINGYFAVAYAENATTVVLHVYNDAGVLQGSALSLTVPSSGASLNCFKLVEDGTDFFLVTQSETLLAFECRKVSSSGALLLTNISGSFLDPGANLKIDAFVKDGYLVAIHNQESGAIDRWAYFVVETDNLFLKTQTTSFGSAVTVGGSYGRVIPCDSFVFAAFYDTASPASSNFYLGKYEDTAISGVAITAAAKGNVLQINQGVGNHFVNEVKGSSPMAFDMNSANIVGNKGTVMSNNVTLGGVV